MPEGRGPIDWEALSVVERLFRDRFGDLLDDVEYVPDAIDPVELRLSLPLGFEHDACRFDVQWWTNHGYKYHYVEGDGDLEFRFGWERRPGSEYPEKHFHPPTDLDEHRQSCITHEEPELVTLAVIACWWWALEADDPSRVNEWTDPP